VDSALVLHAACALLISSVATVLALRYARRRRLLDGPGRRRAHSVPTPRGGGIAIVVSALCCVGPVLGPAWAAALLGLALIAVAGVGWWDDHASLSPLPRIVVHLLAGVALAVVVLGIAQTPTWATGGSSIRSWPAITPTRPS